jgi:dTDP-4-dehydrorhamnose 3,5-epimerase
VLSDSADVTYKCTSLYHAASSRAIRWNDPEIGLEWPRSVGADPVLSAADAAAPLLSSEVWFP